MEKYQNITISYVGQNEKSTWQKLVILDLINNNHKWDALSFPGLHWAVTNISPEKEWLSGLSTKQQHWRPGWVNLLKSQLLPIKNCQCMVSIYSKPKEGNFNYSLISSTHPSTCLDLPSGVWASMYFTGSKHFCLSMCLYVCISMFCVYTYLCTLI